MYREYWGLTELPFENLPDPRFFYPSAEHQEALLRLFYAVNSRKGAAMLTGRDRLRKNGPQPHADPGPPPRTLRNRPGDQPQALIVVSAIWPPAPGVMVKNIVGKM